MLAGASGGGTWALWCALDRPERVRGLVMLGSIPLLPGARIPLGIKIVATPVVGDVLTRAVRPGPRMLRRLMSQVGEGDTILRHPDLFEALLDAAHDPVATAANVAEFRALLTPFGTRAATRIRPADLRRVAAPTLMIWGDRDPVVPIADARAVAQLIPDARLEVLPAGHVPQLGNPERVAQLVERFARSCASSTQRVVREANVFIPAGLTASEKGATSHAKPPRGDFPLDTLEMLAVAKPTAATPAATDVPQLVPSDLAEGDTFPPPRSP